MFLHFGYGLLETIIMQFVLFSEVWKDFCSLDSALFFHMGGFLYKYLCLWKNQTVWYIRYQVVSSSVGGGDECVPKYSASTSLPSFNVFFSVRFYPQ